MCMRYVLPLDTLREEWHRCGRLAPAGSDGVPGTIGGQTRHIGGPNIG